jgi:hypothetical protein
MAGYSDYYSLLARVIADLPGKTHEARSAVYELARTALQERLRTLDPPISETDLAVERSALEVAIARVEAESRLSERRHDTEEEMSLLGFLSTGKQSVRSLRDKLNSIIVRGDSWRAAISAGVAQRLDFLQRTSIAEKIQQRILRTFGDGQRFIKYPKIRIAVGLIVVALIRGISILDDSGKRS